MVVVRGDKTYFNLVVLATEGFVQRGRRPRGSATGRPVRTLRNSFLIPKLRPAALGSTHLTMDALSTRVMALDGC